MAGTHVVVRRISWMECDRSGRIRHPVVFDWVVDAEVDLLRRAGVVEQVYDALPRVSVDAEFRRPLQFDDEVAVELAVDRLGRTSARYTFAVRRGEELCVHGRSTVVYVRDGRGAPLPDALRAALESIQVAGGDEAYDTP